MDGNRNTCLGVASADNLGIGELVGKPNHKTAQSFVAMEASIVSAYSLRFVQITAAAAGTTVSSRVSGPIGSPVTSEHGLDEPFTMVQSGTLSKHHCSNPAPSVENFPGNLLRRPFWFSL